MFDVLVEQSALAVALKKIKNTVGNNEGDNSKMLYVSCEVDNGTTVLKLITNNMSEISEITIPIISGTVGVAPLLDYTKFYSIIDTINNKLEIQLTSTATDDSLSLGYVGRTKPIIFHGLPTADYIMPSVQQNVIQISMPFAILREGLNVAASVIIDNESYPKFNCTMIKIANKVIEFSAIDSMSKRMLLFSEPVNAVDAEFFIECNKTRKMLAGFMLSKNVEINLSVNNIVFVQDNLSLTTRLTSGTFPDVNKFMPVQFKSELEFDKTDMLQSLSRINIMTDDKFVSNTRSCVFHIADLFTTLNLNSKYGTLSEIVICSLKGTCNDIAFNISSVITALNSFSEDKLKICFINEKYGIIMDDSKDHIHKCLIPATLIHKEEI